MECEFCKNTFSTKGNLLAHQKRSKYCLALQDKKPDKVYKCKYCEREFTLKHSYADHINIHESNPLLVSYYERNRECQKIIEDQRKTIENLQKNINELKEETKDYKKQIERLATKAISKPTTTYNNTLNNNVTNNIITADMLNSIDSDYLDSFKIRLTSRIFTSPLYSGGSGIAKWLLDYPLKNNIYCSDTSRRKFRYRVGDTITSDLKGRNIWKISLESYYDDMVKFIDKEIQNISENENLDLKTKTKISMDYMNTKNDLCVSYTHKTQTETEEDFSNFLTTNTHTKETLLLFFEQQKEMRAIEEEEMRIESEARQAESRRLFNERFRIENGEAIPIEQ